MRIGKAALGLAAALAMGLAGGAQATTLADLNGGASLTVGSLTFSNFTITVTGSADPNLADYTVLSLASGFRIVGGVAAFNAEQGDVSVSYTVSDSAGVDGASLGFNGAAVGTHSGATVSEDLSSSGNPIASALVFQLGSGASQKTDSVSFAPETSFTVDKNMLVKADANGLATLSFVDQQFAVVPEPGSLILFSSGLMGLLAFGRKRKS